MLFVASVVLFCFVLFCFVSFSCRFTASGGEWKPRRECLEGLAFGLLFGFIEFEISRFSTSQFPYHSLLSRELRLSVNLA